MTGNETLTSRSRPVATSPIRSHHHTTAASMYNVQAKDLILERLCKSVIQTMATQASTDLLLEETKSMLTDVPVEAAFDRLRRNQFACVADQDLYVFVQDMAGEASFCSLATLIRELQHYQCDSVPAASGRLSLREFAVLVYPRLSNELAAISMTGSDNEVRNVIYLIRRSIPCPACGMRCQRDADCAGCPSIMCPMCGTSFHCFMVVSDREVGYQNVLPVTGAIQLQRFLDLAARTAVDMEHDRKQLWLFAGDGLKLCEAFSRLANGRLSISASMLQVLFKQHDHNICEEAFNLLWSRYTGRQTCHSLDEIAFSQFKRQIWPAEWYS